MRTSRDAVPDGKALSKRFHGGANVAREGGLNRAQYDVLRAYRDGWEWSPYMPKPEGSDKTPTTPRYRVSVAMRTTGWDEPMLVARVVYTATEGEMVSVRITVGF